MLRTTEYQHALARLGYVAPRHSAHLTGYAVDLERLWYEESDRDAHQAASDVLLDLFEREVINLIEESTHWHICLNPEHIHDYQMMAQQWQRGEAQ
jgi:hypothetical protein